MGKITRKIRWFEKFVNLYDDVSDKIEIPENDFKEILLKNHLPRKQAESYRGFMVYVSRTYTELLYHF